MSDIDLEKYRKHVAHFDLPEEKKTELLRIVWKIMQSFVDRAFGDDPVQLARGRGDKSEQKDAPDSLPVIDWEEDHTPDNQRELTRSFRASSDGDEGRKR